MPPVADIEFIAVVMALISELLFTETSALESATSGDFPVRTAASLANDTTASLLSVYDIVPSGFVTVRSVFAKLIAAALAIDILSLPDVASAPVKSYSILPDVSTTSTTSTPFDRTGTPRTNSSTVPTPVFANSVSSASAVFSRRTEPSFGYSGKLSLSLVSVSCPPLLTSSVT